MAALDALLAKLAADGLIKAGGNSTHVVAAVPALNRLELAGERAGRAGGAGRRAPGLAGAADLP